MRVKIVAPLVALLVLLAVGVVGYIAVLGIKVDGTAENLTGDWLSTDRATAINLRHDGTFVANGVSRCIGDVGVVLDGLGRPSDLTVTDGEGGWRVEPNDDNSDILIMNFSVPQHFEMRWQAYHVTWQFRPTAVTLVSLNPPTSADGVLGHCQLQARESS